MARMENIILALRMWKSICKSVVEEDSKKWQLVNTPLAMVGKKEAERKCNSKKKKTAEEGKMAMDELVGMKSEKKKRLGGPAKVGVEIGDRDAQQEAEEVATVEDHHVADWQETYLATQTSHIWPENSHHPAEAISFEPHAPQNYPPCPPHQEPAVYGFTYVDHQPEWSHGAYGCSATSFQVATIQQQPMVAIKKDADDLEQFGLDHFKATAQLAWPDETIVATDASAAIGRAYKDVDLVAQEIAFFGPNNVVHTDTDGLKIPPARRMSAVGSQHGIKRSRDTAGTDDEEVPAAARQQRIEDDPYS